MKIRDQGLTRAVGIVFLFMSLISCATVPELTVNYRLPPESKGLKGHQFVLSFKDLRSSKEILGAGASREFKRFPGNVTLSLARGKETAFKIGVYDIPALFMEVFKRRLEGLGARIVQEPKGEEVELVIALKEFFMDLSGRTWVVTMEYEARIVKGKDILAKQTISGQAERFKLVGRSQADTVVSEIFTDLVNRVDVSSLLEKANL